MTSLFLDVLNTSFSATWVVLAVVLARLLLKKAPRWTICGLWALVAARLLIGSGITAPFSMIPSTEVIPPQSLYEQAPAIHSGVTILDNAINPVYTESLRPMPGASVNPLQIWTAVFAYLWAAGMAVMALWAVVSWLRVRRQVRESICDNGVYLCDQIASPFIFGLFLPKIYLPSDLSNYARAHVIAHEQAHLRRRDHWWKPLGFVLLTVNWFNPAMWLAYILLCRDIEMACDEKVVQNYAVEEKKAYSAALLRCSVNSRRITACPLAFGEVGVKQRVKSVLNYKKPAFWVILAAVVLTTVLAVGLLTSPESPTPEIRWEGTLYVQNGRPAKELPQDAVEVGTLEGIELYHSYARQNGFAVNLSESYVGLRLYLANETLYLTEIGGNSWLPFVPKHSPGDVCDLLAYDVQCILNLISEEVTLTDFLSKDGELELRQILMASLERMEPSMDWDFHMLANNYAENTCILIDKMDFSLHWLLLRRENDWLMVYRDENWAASAWAFESPELDAFIAPWQNDLSANTAIFAPFATGDNAICLENCTYAADEIVLRYAIPTNAPGSVTTDTQWERQAHASYADKTISIQCRPYGRQDWMEIRYRDQREPLHTYGFQSMDLTLENGATGTLYHSNDPDRWSEIVLNTTQGQLYVTAPIAAVQQTDWIAEDYRMALAILNTLSLTRNGNSLFGTPADDENLSLGICLHLENITSDGATLVCTQDGTLWHEIITGSNWSMQKYQDGEWVELLPEESVWTAVAYPIPIGGSRSFSLNWSRMVGTLEPGRYRIGKHFTAYEQVTHLQAGKESVGQTCYAEFELNPLGIRLHMESVAPGGAKLICTQDGTPWKTITTGSDWTLEKHTADGWVSVLPEDTTWSDIAIEVKQGGITSMSLNWNQFMGVLEPGRYRVGKTFTGFGEFTVDGTCALGEGARQTCCAEFIIEQPTASSQEHFSDELRQAVQELWRAYDAMSEFDRLASSTMPGSGTREYDEWTAVEQFVGREIPNPLEALDSLEKGNWAAAPVGYNGGSRFYVSFHGTRDGQVQRVAVDSGYRRDGMRVAVKAELHSDSPENARSTEITADSGEEYEARTATLTRGSLEYTLRVMGDPGTGEALQALLEELLPYFEEISA